MKKLSHITILEALDAFDFRTHAEVEDFALRFECDHILPSGVGVQPKVIACKKWILERPGAIGPRGAPLQYEVIEHLLAQRLIGAPWSSECPDPNDIMPKLVRALELDGFRIEGTELRPILPEELELPQKESHLESLLQKHGFSISLGHLNQARQAYVRGSWAAANGQLRSFIEDLLMQMAKALEPTATVQGGGQAIQVLARLPNPLVSNGLGEWDGQGHGFIEGFWKRLHAQGAHPGLSDDVDCSFRLQLVLIVASHYLALFDQRL
jgi:hypothetical protein